MIEESVFYANPDGRIFEAVFRAGKNIYPNCTPYEDFPSIAQYISVETSFYRISSGLREGLPVVFEAIVNEPKVVFIYSISSCTKAQCLAHCNYSRMIVEGQYLDSICKKYNFSRVKTAEPEKPKAPETVGVFCRGCNNFYDYASPDHIVEDNKITCWSCAGHYIKCRRGLLNDSQIMLVKKFNNLIC